MPRFALPLLSMLLAAHVQATPALPDRVILVGDSTMASTTGYGDALCARFTPETSCLNLARGGRSSGSFRAEGRWDEVTKLLGDGAGFRKTYVLIQFGHNDQPGKPGRSTDFVTEFPANMKRYVEEARALGGVPVLVTPLTRRSFKDGYVHNDLAPWAAIVRDVARADQHVLLVLTETVVADADEVRTPVDVEGAVVALLQFAVLDRLPVVGIGRIGEAVVVDPDVVRA